jgi:glycosyltransferase involved in cell wall biosynthesis
MCLLLHMPLRCGGLNPLTALRDYQVQMKRSHFLQLHASVLVANSHMKEEFVRNGVKPEKVFTLPLPIDEASSKPHYRSFESRPLSGRILFMGRLTKLKGVGCLFPALEMAQKRLGFQLHLTVAGSGPEDVRLREAATRLPFTVDFAGWVDRKGQEALFEISDLLVVPSLWPEPFGLVGLEAAAFGVPAVAFNVGGISSWLESGSNGELAPGNPPTAEGLSDAIERALSDPDHHTALCKRAVQKALQFSTNAHVEALQSILMASVQ